MQKRVSEVELVDDEILGGKDVARTDDIDFRVWVAKGDQPVPQRAVITYKKAPGSPQFQADLADWNFAPQIDKAMFAFVPPAGAIPVPFMVPASSELAPSTVGNKP